MQRATVDLPEPLSPTMPSVRPFANGQRDILGRRHFADGSEERTLAIDFSKFVGLQHHRLGRIGARNAGYEARHRRKQIASVLHGWCSQDAVKRSGLDQPPMTHHRDAIGNLRDNTHVMGNKQHGGAAILLQVPDQAENLLLGGDVERGGRLVRDQQFRFQHQRHRDHDALSLAARQPMRVGRKNTFDLGQPHLFHHGQNALSPRACIEIGMDPQHLVDLAADRHHRIERGHRFLEDHRHGGGAQMPQPPVAGAAEALHRPA